MFYRPKVTIDGVDCTIGSATATKIICDSGAHKGSGKFDVNVYLGDNGLATHQVF